MKNLVNNILVGLGVIFLIIIISGVVFFIVDPYNLKPLIFGTSFTPVKNSGSNTKSTSTATPTATGGSFQLSEAQKQALVSFGIDPTNIPNSISAEQETCFVGALGQARVVEIKAGAVPSGIEFFKAKGCI